MPPSGYKKIEAIAITSFLKSLSISLKDEGYHFELTPKEAMKREINNIDNIISAKQYGEIENSVLLLTKNFYLELLKYPIVSYDDFLKSANTLIDKIDGDILSIHVPTIFFKNKS